jgi:hypothetical protein
MGTTRTGPSELRDALRNVRWLGGGSGAGKSTVARRLAERHGLRLYSCDDMQAAHTGRSNPAEHPLLHAFVAMSMDERWVQRTPEEMLDTLPALHGEGFDLIVEDLVALPAEPRTLVEGYKLLPRLVEPLISRRDQAIWLVPTPEFRSAAMERRGSTWEIAGRTKDPERALANLLARDALYTRRIEEEAVALRLPMIPVDGTLGIEELTTTVGERLGLKAASRPSLRRS